MKRVAPLVVGRKVSILGVEQCQPRLLCSGALCPGTGRGEDGGSFLGQSHGIKLIQRHHIHSYIHDRAGPQASSCLCEWGGQLHPVGSSAEHLIGLRAENGVEP